MTRPARGSKLALSPMGVAALGCVLLAAGGATAYVLSRPQAPTADATTTPAAATVVEAVSPAPVPSPQFIVEHGVRYQDDELVRRFIDLGFRCGEVNGADFNATIFDLMRERTDGIAGPRYTYETKHERKDGYDYVVVRESVFNHKGEPMPGLTGALDHTYLYDAGRRQFEYVESEPEDAGFDRQKISYLPPPMQALAMFKPATCDFKYDYSDVRQRYGLPARNTSPAGTAVTQSSTTAGPPPELMEGAQVQ